MHPCVASVLPKKAGRRSKRGCLTASPEDDEEGRALSIEGGDAKRKTPPWWVLAVIGCMNGSGNFFQAIGQTHTPGETQAGLNLIGIPLVMTLSYVFLKKRSVRPAAPAAIIFLGSVVTALPDIMGSDSGSTVVTYWYLSYFTLQRRYFLHPSGS